MEDKINSIVGIVGLVMTILLGLFSNETNKAVIYPIIFCIIVSAIVFIIVFQTKRNKNLSNTAVITKTKKYTKYLWKLVKANKRRMNKEINISELSKIDKYNKRIINKMYGKKDQANIDIEFIKAKEEKQKLIANYVRENEKYISTSYLDTNEPLNKLLDHSDYQQTLLIYNNIYDTIKDVERILLQLEQHNLRIKFGKYVVEMGNNIDHMIHAYVDLIGWTHILLGDNKRGLASIQNGLDLIDYQINFIIENDKNYKENPKYYDYLYQKARALRHMGTTYYTYVNEKDTFVKEKLLEAIALLSTEDVLNFASKDAKFKEKYSKMMFGLKYNNLLYDYYQILKNKNIQIDSIKNIDKGVEELYKEVLESPIEDNHRLVKILTFKNQIDRDIIMHTKGNIEKESNDYTQILRKDLKKIEEVLNKNIYFDEAMEVYICQKVEDLYAKVEDVFEK